MRPVEIDDDFDDSADAIEVGPGFIAILIGTPIAILLIALVVLLMGQQ